MFKTTEDYLNDRLVFLVYGKSGSGKTRLARTLPDPSRVCIINFENGLLSIRKGPKMAVYDCTVDAKGAIMERKHRFEKLLYFLKDVAPLKAGEFDWLVFDSLTEAAQNLVEALKGKYPEKKDGLVLWGEYSDVIIQFVKQLRDYKPFNILLLALDAVDKDDSGRRFIGVDINGKASQRLPALLDEVFYLQTFKKEDGSEVQKLITSNYETIIAKDRSGSLDKFEEPNLKTIIEKIHGTYKQNAQNSSETKQN